MREWAAYLCGRTRSWSNFPSSSDVNNIRGWLPTCVEGRGVELMFRVPQMWTTLSTVDTKERVELPTCVEGRGVELMFCVPPMWTTWEVELPTCVEGRGVELMFRVPQMWTTWESELPTCVEGRGVELMFRVPQMWTTWEGELPTSVEGRGGELMFRVPPMWTPWESYLPVWKDEVLSKCSLFPKCEQHERVSYLYLCGRTRCWADVPCSPDVNNIVHCTHHREGWPAAHHSANFVLKR